MQRLLKTEKKVLDTIRHYDMIKEGSHVTAALSGGADSVCLLLILRNLQEDLGFSLSALHINHHLRGAESDRDADFAKKLCDSLGIEIRIAHVDVKGRMQEEGESCETAARELRYQVFRDYEVCATAHTASDDLETSVYNYMRGSGIKGISGIPPVRDNLIRPLLRITRKEVEDYLSEKNTSFVTDSTNLTDDYSRNRIRHHLIPLMKQWNPGLERTSVKNRESLREDLDFIEKSAERAYGENLRTDGGLFLDPTLHRALRSRMVIYYLKERGADYGSLLLEKIVGADNVRVQISAAEEAVLENYVLYIKRRQEKQAPEELARQLKLGENSLFEGHTVTVRLESDENIVKKLKFNNLFTICAMDYDKIKGRLILRNRRFGDRIRPFGKSFHVSVKKWLQSAVKKEDRKYIHFICDEEGLAAVQGLGTAARLAPDKNTKNFLVIEFAKDFEEEK